jgi:hypothetical protein
MTGPTDSDQPYPGSRLSLQYFHATTRKYLVALSEAHYSLQEMCASLFDEDLTIQPIDCREAADALEEMYAIVQKCSSLLDDASLLPVATLAPRYRLLFASQLALDQTRRLIDLFNSYCVMCLKPSPQAESMRKTIQEVFQAVLKYISDIPRQALHLEEESKSMEQELIAALHEEYT